MFIRFCDLKKKHNYPSYLIFNTIICEFYVNVKNNSNNYLIQKGKNEMKIYDYNGSKNLSGDRIHAARCQQRLTQSDLAARMQVNGIILERDSISRIEIGTRFVADYELMVFSKVLNVSVEWLLGMQP